MPTTPDGPPAHLDELLAAMSEHERLAMTLGMELTRLGRIGETLFERSSADFGLNASEATTLTALLFVGPPHQMLPTEIRRRVVHTSAGVTSILRRLESKGLIERIADPTDGRRMAVRLTVEGDQLVRKYLQHRSAQLAAIFSRPSVDLRPEVFQVIEVLVAQLERATGYSHAFHVDQPD